MTAEPAPRTTDAETAHLVATVEASLNYGWRVTPGGLKYSVPLDALRELAARLAACAERCETLTAALEGEWSDDAAAMWRALARDWGGGAEWNARFHAIADALEVAP